VLHKLHLTRVDHDLKLPKEPREGTGGSNTEM
jgi:hypothetical protein